MDRRGFLASSLAAGAAVISSVSCQAKQGTVLAATEAAGRRSKKGKFKLKYAPYLGHFKHHAGDNYVDEIKFLADEGFTAAFHNWWSKFPVETQKAAAEEMARQDMTLGPFVAIGDFESCDFVHEDKDGSVREMLVDKMNKAIEIAKRMNGKWILIVPGLLDQGMEWEYQTANAIEKLKWCAEVCEKANVVIVLEPLNPWKDHPGLFLSRIPQAYQICKAVDSPSCKIVDDLYHQQITEGNLIPNMDAAWSEIAAFHLGDNPGRKEPTTGEINFKNIFKHIHNKGYDGVLCMEHGQSKPGKAGERAVIEAYRQCDNF